MKAFLSSKSANRLATRQYLRSQS